MNIDILNAYCGPWLVYCPCLAQGRLNIHPVFGWHWDLSGWRPSVFKMLNRWRLCHADPRDLSRVGWLACDRAEFKHINKRRKRKQL